MKASSVLSEARRRAGLTQRGLAAGAGVPQSTVGRIEAGAIDARATTLVKLLQVCGYDLELAPRIGEGIDRSLIRTMLRMTPRERVEHIAAGAEDVAKIRAARRRR